MFDPAGSITTRFRDASEHRAQLPSPYNSYTVTTADAAYDADLEDLLILYRPLFFTSYMLADEVEDNDFYGASVLALSSASSKTAYGAAFLLQGKGPSWSGSPRPATSSSPRVSGVTTVWSRTTR